jgi:hypothetical protein
MKKTTFEYLKVNLGTINNIKKFLAEYDINAKTKSGWTPLMWATFFGYYDIVKYLLEHKPDLSAKNVDKQSALMIATEQGNSKIVALLENAIKNSDRYIFDYIKETVTIPTVSQVLERYKNFITTEKCAKDIISLIEEIADNIHLYPGLRAINNNILLILDTISDNPWSEAILKELLSDCIQCTSDYGLENMSLALARSAVMGDDGWSGAIVRWGIQHREFLENISHSYLDNGKKPTENAIEDLMGTHGSYYPTTFYNRSEKIKPHHIYDLAKIYADFV